MAALKLFDLTDCENNSIITPFNNYSSWFPTVYLFCVIVSLVVVIVGLIGNVLNMLVLFQLRTSLPYRLMLVMAAFDFLRLVGNFVDFIFHLLEGMIDNLDRDGVEGIAYVHGLVLVAKHTGSNASIYVLAFLSVLQVRSVKHPMKIVRRSVVDLIVFLLCFIQFLLCAPYAILTTAFYCPAWGRFKFLFSRQEVTLYRVYVEAILHTILPTILVAAVSHSLLQEVRKANVFRAGAGVSNNAPLSVSKAVLKLNLIFLACNIPHAVYIALYIYRLVHGVGFGLEIKNMIVVFADLAACVNSGINFLIYYTTDFRFKESCQLFFGRGERSSQQISFSNRSNTREEFVQHGRKDVVGETQT